MAAKNKILHFTKMSGAGNDFIVFDNRDRRYQLTRSKIAAWCHRQLGIGADGVLAVEPATKKGHDFRMRYYNADGGEAEMCGNGSRCIARFYHRLLHPRSCDSIAAHYAFQTMAGTIQADVRGEWVRLNMTDPHDLRLNLALKVGGKKIVAHSINTGVPHVVVFVRDAEKTDVLGLGRDLRWHRAFQPAGTNVNFVQIISDRSIRVRTYERGVENETLACGTGVTASGIIASLVRGIRQPVSIKVQSGCTLEVDFCQRDGCVTDVFLAGPATFVFEGQIAS